jgi:hypothetical protein
MIMLNDAQVATLRAMLDCIIPPDDFPGAVDAGVDEYVLRLANLNLIPNFQWFCECLDKVNDLSISAYAKSLVAVSFAESEALLKRMEAGEFDQAGPENLSDWFWQLCELAAEGYYADPGNGGNRNFAAWRMVGFRVPC